LLRVGSSAATAKSVQLTHSSAARITSRPRERKGFIGVLLRFAENLHLPTAADNLKIAAVIRQPLDPDVGETAIHEQGGKGYLAQPIGHLVISQRSE